MNHASAVGRHVDAKWYSRAVSRFHVGQSAVTLTTPDMTMNLTQSTRRTHANGWPAASSPRADSDAAGA